MEHGIGYGIRIEHQQTKGVILYLTHDGVDTGTSFSYLIDDVTIGHLINTIKSWYMYGAIREIEDRDRLIENAKQLWLPN